MSDRIDTARLRALLADLPLVDPGEAQTISVSAESATALHTASTALPALLDEVDRLRAQLDRRLDELKAEAKGERQ